MTDRDADAPSGNGRRIALAIVLIAFVASATTAILAFTASKRANQRDAVGMQADTADLHDMLSHGTSTRDTALVAWKPRTPCGAQARDWLDERLRAPKAGGGENTSADLAAELDRTLRDCTARRGRDVDL